MFETCGLLLSNQSMDLPHLHLIVHLPPVLLAHFTGPRTRLRRQLHMQYGHDASEHIPAGDEGNIDEYEEAQK